MPQITVEDGYAFDYLCVLKIKFEKHFNQNNQFKYLDCAGELKRQYGEDLFDKIINSDEYGLLYNVNLRLFERIDELHAGTKMPAEALDDLNKERFKYKDALQKRFFNRELTEFKTYYGK